MTTKLTLKLDENVIRSAKKYAEKHHNSLSKMVENYFFALAEEDEENKNEITGPISRSLSGIIKSKKIIDRKKEYADYLAEKYK